jgi:hypothetical protein
MTHHITDHLTFGLRKEIRIRIHANTKNKSFHKSSQLLDSNYASLAGFFLEKTINDVQEHKQGVGSSSFK